MKKRISFFLAFVIVLAASAFTVKHHANAGHARTNIQFHFIPADGSQQAYLDPDSWEVVTTDPGCSNSGSDPCMISIDDANLADVSDNEAAVASLVSFLNAQDGEGGEYANPTAAVADLTTTVKP